MNIKEIEKILIDSGIEKNEAKIEAKMFANHFLGLTSVDLALCEELTGSQDSLNKLIEAVNLRAQTRKPIQHIIGSAYFMGESFFVDENVLIPRDETEILVRKAAEFLGSKNSAAKNKLKVLEIGTGSGCIACMISKITGVDVLSVDISKKALEVASKNVVELGLENHVTLLQSDLFSKIGEGEKFELIVSNPPYIPLLEREFIQEEVKFDPELALYTSDVLGVEFYQKITDNASKYLERGGGLMFELGINQSKIVFEFMSQRGFKNIMIEKDLAGIERVIFASFG